MNERCKIVVGLSKGYEHVPEQYLNERVWHEVVTFEDVRPTPYDVEFWPTMMDLELALTKEEPTVLVISNNMVIGHDVPISANVIVRNIRNKRTGDFPIILLTETVGKIDLTGGFDDYYLRERNKDCFQVFEDIYQKWVIKH